MVAGVVFWLIDVRRDHCPGVSGEQQLRNLAEGVADRTGLRDEGERPDDVVPVIRPPPRYRGPADDRQRGCDRRDVLVLPADEHDSGVAAHQAVGELLLLSLGERRRYRQPQVLAQTLDGLIRPMRGRLAWMPPGGRHQHSRRPQAVPHRAEVRLEQGGEGAGALPSARQQRMLVLAALVVNARQRRLKRFLRVPDDVDDFGRHVHPVNVRHDVRSDRCRPAGEPGTGGTAGWHEG